MRQTRQPLWGALVLLLVLFAQLLSAASHLSATVDEPFHLTSGYEYLRTGRLQLFDEHTPLAKALFAWPLFLVSDLVPPETASGYANGDLIAAAQETLLAYRPLDRVIVAPRIAASLLTILLAATIFRCAKRYGGPEAGLLALILCTFDPNFLAQGSLATTDMGATAFIFWMLWAGTRWIEHPTRKRWLSAALLLGLAQGAKLTALLIYPVLGLGVLFNAEAQRRKDAEWGKLLFAFAGMMGTSLLVLWALYGFELRPVAGLLGGLPLPAASHIERWLRLQENLAYGREAFLLGQNSMRGWPLYFPVAFLIKTPLPLLLLLAYRLLRAAYCVFRIPFSRFTHHALRSTFYLFPLLYAAASLTSPLNIGYRHLLPVLPFLYVGIANGVQRMADETPRITHHASRFTHYALRITQYALLAWLALGTLRLAPHYLTFFNELAGGAGNGWRFLADSNTDWGQAFKALANYQKTHNLGPVRLSAFTFYDPAAYGVDYTPIAPMTDAPPVLPGRFNPAPGVYAISATTLDGVPLAYPPTFDWFKHQEPFEKIGNALFLYNVQPLVGTWIAQCSAPVAPLSEAAIDEGFGVANLRRISFDCEQSWVQPGGGPGWYARAIPEQTALHWPGASIDTLLPNWAAKLTGGAKLSYVQPRNGELPAFAVWECMADGLTSPQKPLELADVLAYRGMSAPGAAHPGVTIDVLTFWEVLDPPTKPLSLMLHLRSADSAPIAIGDALGFPVEQWQPGDQFVQRHHLVIPAETAHGEYQLIAGAYWIEDLTAISAQHPISTTLTIVAP